MTAEYELTKEDWSVFNLYHHFHSPTAQRQYRRGWFVPAIGLLVIILGICFLASAASQTPSTTFLALLPLFIGPVFYLVWYPWAYRRKLKKIVEGMIVEGRNKILFGRQRVVLSPDAIIKSGQYDQTSIAWAAVERVVKDREHLFIYTSALTAFIVPQRAFADSVGFDQFAMTALSHYEHAVASACPE